VGDILCEVANFNYRMAPGTSAHFYIAVEDSQPKCVVTHTYSAPNSRQIYLRATDQVAFTKV